MATELLFFMPVVKHSNGCFDVRRKRSWVFGSALSGQFVGCGSGHIKGYAPIFYTQGSSINCYPSVESGVARLFFFGGPTAVIRLIISIIIDTFNRVVGTWPFAHIGKECLEAIKPSVADFDASVSIDRKFRVLGVVTALFHFSPYFVFSYCALTVRAAVFGLTQKFCGCFFGQATTAKGVLADVGSGNRGHSAAVAFTGPHGVSATFWTWSAAQNSQATSAKSSNIKGFWHIASTKGMLLTLGRGG